ncbi:hypothetical protein CRG98_004568 [Punica granatum]|uniref:Aspartic peptidase DDI1-type domain-containing protein n=1 Tax=Punica granatum TaxID=22663 RepID=A0A2I0L332_PUNGR|nr:hypothetical protein CRG98_004568 [Punica granatum]
MNPLPDHGSGLGLSVNMISIATIGEDDDLQEILIPFIIDYPPAEVPFAFAPFVIEVPTKEPYQDRRVPWDYGGKVANMEPEMSAMGMTLSGRVYQGLELVNKGKAPILTFSTVSETLPLPSKKVTDQEAEAFIKVIKASEYKVVEQMGKSPAHISLLALLLSFEPHRDVLLKVLTTAQISKETTPDRIEETVSSILSNQISFTEDELPSEGQGHLWALHIVCKCNNHVVGRVMIDNGSALNVCPISTLKQMNVDISRIRASKTIVRAFDGSKRILEIPNAFSLLLGRPWIHAAGAVPSSLHQKLKFFVKGKLITVNGKEDYAHRVKHLHRLATHYGKLSRGISVPPLSQFFSAPPQIMGGTSDSPITESNDFSSDAVEALLALPVIYTVTEETSSRVHIHLAREDEELTNWTAVPLYSAMVADV